MAGSSEWADVYDGIYCRRVNLSLAWGDVTGLGFMYAEVLRENRYLSRVVEVQDGQEVIDHGLYGMVRHPMYSATLLLFLSIPLILGSPISFVIFLMYPFILVMRIKNEEQVLEKELTGYSAYKKRVRYKLIPLLW